MIELPNPSLADLFGEGASVADMQTQVMKLSSLESVDHVLLSDALPAKVRAAASRHQGVLALLQAHAGDDDALRRLLVSKAVASRPGAARMARRLIDEIRNR